MNRILKFFYVGMLTILVLSGCKKFLDVRPSNVDQINPNTVSDLELLLNNAALAQPNYLLADLVTDNVQLSDQILQIGGSSYIVNAYLWAKDVWTPGDDDYMYNNSYSSILQVNVVLAKIDNAREGTAGRKDIVRAQAKINRAYYYLQLVNLYGKHYQTATASTDLAVPLVVYPDATAKPARATVQAIYDLILADLNDAINTPALPDFKVDVIRPYKAAAYALLARTYLFMGDYEKALAAADSALRIKSTILDYRTFSFVSQGDLSQGVNNKPITLKAQETNPEALLSRIATDFTFFINFNQTFYCSKELETLLGAKDLRFLYNFYKTGSNTFSRPPSFRGGSETTMKMLFNYGIDVPEMMLTKAECLARRGQAAEAMKLVNELRVYRFKTADYVPLQATDGEAALRIVLEERRRELFLHGGLRLFDLKRLNLDNRFKKNLKRVSNIDGSSKANLEAGSPKYLLPFTPKNIANNPLIVQNER